MIDENYRARVFGLQATCRLVGGAKSATLYYPRHTKLGKALISNTRQERAVLSNYIRQEFGWSRGEGNATPVSFVGR